MSDSSVREPGQAMTDRPAGQAAQQEPDPAARSTPAGQSLHSADNPIVIDDDDDDDDDNSNSNSNSNNHGGGGGGGSPENRGVGTTYSMKEAMDRCLKLLNERIQASNLESSEPGVAKIRYGILRNACLKGDLFYIIFHKLFCLWTLDPGRALESFSTTSTLAVTSFTIFLGILRNNTDIPRDHLTWFANFPEFLPRVEGHLPELQRLLRFLSLFATRWTTLVPQIVARGYPLMAGESLVSLQCASDTLNNILFTLSRRVIGIADGPKADQLMQLFALNLTTERKLARLTDASQVAQKTVARHRMALTYRQLIDQPDQQQQQSRSTSRSTSQQPAGQQQQQQQQQQQPQQQDQSEQHPPQQHPPQQHPSQQHPPQQYPPQHLQNQPQQQHQLPQLRPKQQNQPQQPQQPQQQQHHPQQRLSLQTQPQLHQRQMSQQGQQQILPQTPSAYHNSQQQAQPSPHLQQQMHVQYQQQARAQAQAQAKMRAQAQQQQYQQQQFQQQQQQQQQQPQQQQQQHYLYQTPAITNLPNYQILANFNQSPGPQVPSQITFQGQAHPASPHVDFDTSFTFPQAPVYLSQPALAIVTNGMASPTTPTNASYAAGNQGRWPVVPAPIQTPSPGGYQYYQYLNGQVQSPASLQGSQTAQAISSPHTQQNAQGSHPPRPQNPFMHPMFQPPTPAPLLLSQNRLVSSPVAIASQQQSPTSFPFTQTGLSARQTLPHHSRAGSTPTQAPVSSRIRSSSEQFTTRVLHVHEHPGGVHDSTSLQAGLHLVNWRSPKRAPMRLLAQPRRYYQFVDSFAVGPEQIVPQMKVINLQFELSAKEAAHIPEVSVPSGLQPDLYNEVPVSQYFNGCYRYRLRICRRFDGQTTLSGPSWAVSRTCWPSHIHVIFNQQPQILRRKQHFHHDQPIELTELVIPGLNEVDISFPVYPQNCQQNANDFAAVERISTLDHETVWSLVHNHEHVKIEETTSVVKKRLNTSESDDIVVENDSLRVSIVDPFSSQMYVVPVRGLECKHLECIDLQNWLETRPRKYATQPTEPTVVDCWSCPICGLDARPTSLRIDDFFAEVRQKLLEGGNGSAKAIEVAADGSWKAVQEIISDPSPRLAHRDIKRGFSQSSAPLTTSVPETIEILDDD